MENTFPKRALLYKPQQKIHLQFADDQVIIADSEDLRYKTQQQFLERKCHQKIEDGGIFRKRPSRM